MLTEQQTGILVLIIFNLCLFFQFKGRWSVMSRYMQSQAEKDETSDPKYQNRTSMFHDEFKKGNISLKLTNVSKEDGGNYTCFVPKLQSQVRKGNVTLYVGENGAPDIVIGPEGPDGGVNVGWVVVVVVGGFVLLILIFITICVVRRPRDSQRWSNNSRNEEVRNDGEMETEQFQNHRGNSNQGDEAEPLQNQEEPNQSV
ncbi:uncharacterized protein LOC122821060 isoform X2 [Gambusia affinis]|uniref:uncharacterized protein LOC122821060 isoform X2 n=2 Tax=Gambusia affinis TaxID=33528 RepID=UPI001CDB9F30|nr:uncharacterized protein LOC122821060 isoform X2 [Gambusia affinis]